MRVLFTVVLIGFSSTSVLAHHSVQALYDDTIVEIEGEVTGVLWRNPHVGFTMNVLDDNGQVQEWDMAMTALSNLRRASHPGTELGVVSGRSGRYLRLPDSGRGSVAPS